GAASRSSARDSPSKKIAECRAGLLGREWQLLAKLRPNKTVRFFRLERKGSGMNLYKQARNRAVLVLLVIVNLMFAGSATVNGQGRGRGKGTSIGGRPEIVVPMRKPEKLMKPAPPSKPP